MKLYEKWPFVIKHYHISICASFQSLPHASGSAFSFCPTYFASTVPYLSSYSNHQRFLVDLQHVFIENDLKNQSESRSRILNWWNSLEAPTLPFVRILGEGLGAFFNEFSWWERLEAEGGIVRDWYRKEKAKLNTVAASTPKKTCKKGKNKRIPRSKKKL